jgi:hypothetical protein
MKPRRGPTRFSSPENSKKKKNGLTWTTPRQHWMDAGWTRDGRLELLVFLFHFGVVFSSWLYKKLR